MNKSGPSLPPLALIAGPTASGKSSLALALAEARNGVVINADSAQVYADLRVLSARPSQEEMQGIEHRLFGAWDGAQACSAADWAAAARREIERAHGENAVPILVGGTGLYIRTLLDGIAPVPDSTVTYQPDVVVVSGGGDAIRAQSTNGFIWTIDANAPHASELAPGKIFFMTNRSVEPDAKQFRDEYERATTAQVATISRMGGDLQLGALLLPLTADQGTLLVEEPLDLEDNQQPVVQLGQAGDVLMGNRQDGQRRRLDLVAVDPHDLGDCVDDAPDRLVMDIHHDRPGLVVHFTGCQAESLA